MFYNLRYFLYSRDGAICASDLDRRESETIVNLNAIASISEIKQFSMPLSSRTKGVYAVVTMVNGNFIFINEKSRTDLVMNLTFSYEKK